MYNEEVWGDGESTIENSAWDFVTCGERFLKMDYQYTPAHTHANRHVCAHAHTQNTHTYWRNPSIL